MSELASTIFLSSIVVSAILIFAVLTTFLLIKRISQSIREKEQHKIELQKTIITTQEEEREVLANNLHDDFGPLLSLLTRKLQQLELDSQTKSIDPAEWTDVHQKLNAIQQDIRKYSHDIFPMQIKKIGLLPSLEYHIRTLQATHRVTFHNDQEINPDFNLAEQLTIYRIFNEVLNNFLKHANASHLDCEISRKKNTFIITLTHNGEPFTHCLLYTSDAADE